MVKIGALEHIEGFSIREQPKRRWQELLQKDLKSCATK